MSKAQNNSEDQRRPFQGLRSFEEKNKSKFGGRDTEINDLFTLVEDFALTVVFGKSGIGKTSLLQAGLLPKLRKNFYYPTYIRIDYSSSKTPLQQVKDLLYGSLVEMDPDIAPMGTVSLWEYMHDVDFMKGLVIPVLILDQFEEIFTLGEKNSGVKELVSELADLVENRIPAVIKEKYKKKGKIVPSRYRKLSYRVVLSLREDYLARLEELKNYMPSIMDNRLRVVQMTISQAMDAAMKPAEDLISKSVAEDIIKILPGVSQSDFDLLKQKGSEGQKLKVEPFLLSLICDRINEKRIKKGLKVITSKLVSKFNVADVINSFYYDSTSKYGQNVEHAIEDLLLTEGGFRKLQALGEMQKHYEISDEVIDELVSARIIRKESRDGVAYVELIHDVLAPVIKKKRDKRQEEEKERQRLEDLRLERAKNRKRMIRIGSILGGLLVVFIGIIAWQTNEVNKIKKEIQRKTRSRELLLSAVSQSINTSEEKDKGLTNLVSRVAYGLYKKDRENLPGVNEVDWKFYSGMLKSNLIRKVNVDGKVVHRSTLFLEIASMSDFGNSISDSGNMYNNNLKLNTVGKKQKVETLGEKNSDRANKSSAAEKILHNMTPTHMVRVDTPIAYYVAFRDKTVRMLTMSDSGINHENTPNLESLNENSTERVSAMAYDTVQKHLAIAKFRTIYRYDKDNNKKRTILIPDTTSKKYRGSFFMSYMPDGSIVLVLGAKLFLWDTTYTNPVSWNKMETKKWRINKGDLIIEKNKDSTVVAATMKKDTKIIIKTDTLLPKPTSKSKRRRGLEEESMLEIKSDSISLSFTTLPKIKNKIKAISVSQNSLIALCIKDKFIIIDKDKNLIHEIIFPKWEEITALSFDPTGKYIVLGDKFGIVYHMEIPSNLEFEGVDLAAHIAHSQKIQDISFNPNDSNIFATASQDGSVAIWNSSPPKENDGSILSSIWNKNKDEKDVWSALKLDPSLFDVEGPALKISFSKGGGYLLVGYEKGKTIRWPTSLEKLNEIICKKTIGEKELQLLLTSNTENIDKTDKEYYCCECLE